MHVLLIMHAEFLFLFATSPFCFDREECRVCV